MNSITIFTSPTCGPCRILKPKLKALCTRLGVTLTELSIADPEAKSAALAAGVRGVPAVVQGDKVLFTGNVDDRTIEACFKANGLI
ncbi:Thioredoxin [compost metagenome]